MLVNDAEIECVKDAWEPGIRDPERSRTDFDNIIQYFFKKFDFNKSSFLDLGPGHYDFGEIVRQRGGRTTSIELDPAVIRLGVLKNLDVIKGDLTDVDVFAKLHNSFDGLFCRGSINARHFPIESDHRKYLDSLISVVKQDGVIWISPCNDPAHDQDIESFQNCVNIQIKFFKERGFKIIECPTTFEGAFGIWSTKPKLIFTKNLDFNVASINRHLRFRSIFHDLPRRALRKLISKLS